MNFFQIVVLAVVAQVAMGLPQLGGFGNLGNLANLGVGQLGQATAELKTILPSSGPVVTNAGGVPSVNTKFGKLLCFNSLNILKIFAFPGAFALPRYSNVTPQARAQLLPVLKALVSIFEKPELSPQDANELLSLSRDLTNQLPTALSSGY